MELKARVIVQEERGLDHLVTDCIEDQGVSAPDPVNVTIEIEVVNVTVIGKEIVTSIMMIVIENVSVIETENVIGNVNANENRPLVGEQ
jgi:hypothetical protein